MTQDDLDRLTNPTLARKAEDARQRSSFRPPWTKATVDITGLEGPYEARLENGTQVTRVALKLQNMRSIEGVTPFTDTSFNLELPLPRQRADGSPPEPNVHSETVLLVESAAKVAPNITSIRGLVGLKGVRLEETVHQYTGRQQVPRDSGNWTDVPLKTYFYEVKAIGAAGAGSNGAKPPVTEARLTEALSIVDGLTHEQAMTALGDDGAEVISKLVLSKAIAKDGDVYKPTAVPSETASV